MSTDIDPDERAIDQLLGSLPPVAPPPSLRDGVLRRIGERRVLWEWLVAAVFAVPSALFLVRQAAFHGEEFMAAFGNVVNAAQSQTSDAFFFVDGLTVIALALLGAACAIAAHAAATTPRRVRR